MLSSDGCWPSTSITNTRVHHEHPGNRRGQAFQRAAQALIVNGLRNQERAYEYNLKLPSSEFTPAALRQAGIR